MALFHGLGERTVRASKGSEWRDGRQ